MPQDTEFPTIGIPTIYSSRPREAMIIPSFWFRCTKLESIITKSTWLLSPKEPDSRDELDPSRPVSNIPGCDCQWRPQASAFKGSTGLQRSAEPRSFHAFADVLHPHFGGSPPTTSSHTVSLPTQPSACSPP